MRTNEPTAEDLCANAVAALERGSKIEAIKILREERGIGLKESKETVEAYLDAHPELMTRMKSASLRISKAALVGWLLLAAVVIWMVIGRQP